MMGGGACWLDYDADGWLDLYLVNSYAESDIEGWQQRGGLPTSRLYHNVRGRFEDVTAASGAGLTLRGSGCVAADLDGNGTTDLFVTSAGYDAERDAYDALLWNDGDGTFTEGAWAAGIRTHGWHTGAAVADVEGDGDMDVFVAGYTDVNNPIPGSQGGYPSNHEAMRDLLYLNVGGSGKHPRFREVGRAAGLEPEGLEHGLGASFLDVDRDGRLDLFVANDLDPNQLYLNVAPGGRARVPLCRARPRARRRRPERRHGHRGGRLLGGRPRRPLRDELTRPAPRCLPQPDREPFADARPAFVRALGQRSTGWGATWVDLDLDGSLELALANGAIPVTNLAKDAERLQVVDDG